MMDKSYKETIAILNSFQATPESVSLDHQKRKDGSYDYMEKLEIATRMLQMIGIQIDDLVKLNAIHVAGTKGKGSTCALTESIFRSCGYKTGLFTGPHLVSVRDRFRINGEPVSEQQFLTHFWSVYSGVKELEKDTLSYFTMLTVIAFSLFYKEKVDVAIIEVGCGGEYDPTNVLTAPIAVGITSLGIDHLSYLGGTIESIAWHKSGIFKKGVPAFTAPQTFESATVILRERAAEKQCPLYVCPPLGSYTTENDKQIIVGIQGDVQHLNVSLALQLFNAWTSDKRHSKCDHHFKQASGFKVSELQLNGIKDCKLRGRCQSLTQGKIHYFLDGAHTIDSIENCIRWFTMHSQKLNVNNKFKKVLMFNCIAQEKAITLLTPLISANFDYAIFTTNNIGAKESKYCEHSRLKETASTKLETAATNRRTWVELTAQQFGKIPQTQQFTCISEAIDYLRDQENKCDTKTLHVLVTGSLYLVGGVLSIINPQL